MRKMFIMNALYLQDKNQKIYALLSKLPNANRERERGSYYKSLSGLFRHVLEVVGFFLGLFHAALPDGSAAKKFLASDPVTIAQGELTEEMWDDLKNRMAALDKVFVDFTSALTDAEMDTPVKPPWLQGKSVPMYFMLNAFVIHQVHHHGQISQILDELNVDNDFSSVSVDFLQN